MMKKCKTTKSQFTFVLFFPTFSPQSNGFCQSKSLFSNIKFIWVLVKQRNQPPPHTLCQLHHWLSLTALFGRQPPPLSFSLPFFSLLVMSKGKEREGEIADRREVWVVSGDDAGKVSVSFTRKGGKGGCWVQEEKKELKG